MWELSIFVDINLQHFVFSILNDYNLSKVRFLVLDYNSSKAFLWSAHPIDKINGEIFVND